MARREHLRRLGQIFGSSRAPLFFLTCCVRNRHPALACSLAAGILVTAWQEAEEVHGWLIGRYVVMPDHVHFFAAPGAEEAKDLSRFMGSWKRWTKKQIRERATPSFAWQPEFFDHLMRSAESYARKWEYVRANPVRAQLVSAAEDWPYQGEVHDLAW